MMDIELLTSRIDQATRLYGKYQREYLGTAGPLGQISQQVDRAVDLLQEAKTNLENLSDDPANLKEALAKAATATQIVRSTLNGTNNPDAKRAIILTRELAKTLQEEIAQKAQNEDKAQEVGEENQITQTTEKSSQENIRRIQLGRPPQSQSQGQTFGH
jgi:hypothetical protein